MKPGSLLLFLAIAAVAATPDGPGEGKPLLLPLENREGLVLEAEVFSLLRNEKDGAWVCFRRPKSDRLFLYPLAFLSDATVSRVAAAGEDGKLVVADGLTARQLEFLGDYLEADPRERLLLGLREARQRERRLAREWRRLQEQTWRVQKQLAAAEDPGLRQRIEPLFRKSLEARDRAGRELARLRAERKRTEDRLEKLRALGVPLEIDPFAD
jgi:hypothetical protein